jgi:hypothetical protein
MSRRLLQLCVAGAVMWISAQAAPPAAGAIWTTNGSASGTAFTASAGTTRFAMRNSSGVTLGLTCTSSALAGSLLGTSADQLLGTVTPSFSGCQLVGQSVKTACDAVDLLGFSFAAPSASLVSGIACRAVKLSGACGNATTVAGGINIVGTLGPSYNNTSQQLTYGNTAQSILATATGVGCVGGALATGDNTTLTSGSGTSLVYSTTSAYKPQMSCTCTGTDEPAGGSTLNLTQDVALAVRFALKPGQADYNISSVVVNAPAANWHRFPVTAQYPLEIRKGKPRLVTILKTAGAAATTVTITTTRPAPDTVVTYNVQ